MTIAFDWDVKPQTNVGGQAQEVLIRYNTVVTENRILYALPDVQAPRKRKISLAIKIDTSSRRQTDSRVIGSPPPDKLGKRRKLKHNNNKPIKLVEC